MPMMPEGLTTEQRIRMLAEMARSKSPMPTQFPEVPTFVPDSAPMQVPSYDPPENPQPYRQPGPEELGIKADATWPLETMRSKYNFGNPFETPPVDPEGINTPAVPSPKPKYKYRVSMADPRGNGVPRR